MILGYLGLAYIVFSVYIIWFGKKKPQKLVARFIYTFLIIVFTLLLTNFSFSPKTSYYIKAFPINLDNKYVETIETEQYHIVIYSIEYESETNKGHDFYVFQEFLGGYIETGIRPSSAIYRNEETNTIMLIKSVVTNERLYFLLYNRDLATYDSLIIGDTVVDLDQDFTGTFTLFPVIKNDDEPLIIILNGIEMTNAFNELGSE